MKANEFIKKYGIEYAIKFLNYNASIAEDRCVLVFGEYYYLKRLVESHEYIESYGGLNESKRAFEMRHGAINLDGWGKLKQAIADVESCHVD